MELMLLHIGNFCFTLGGIHKGCPHLMGGSALRCQINGGPNRQGGWKNFEIHETGGIK